MMSVFAEFIKNNLFWEVHMSVDKRVEATSKDVEGKVQEAWGDLTDDPQNKLEGQAKQVEADAKHKKEDLKDSAKRTIDNV